MRPGIVAHPFLTGVRLRECARLGGVQRGEQGLDRDPPARDELGTTAAQRHGQRCGPQILVDEEGGAAGLERGARLLQVVGPEEPRGGALEDREVELAIFVQIGQGDPGDRAVQLLLDEEQVDDPDDAAIHQVDQQGEALPRP